MVNIEHYHVHSVNPPSDAAIAEYLNMESKCNGYVLVAISFHPDGDAVLVTARVLDTEIPF